MELFRLRAGASPLIVSMPHVGTYIAPELAARMTDIALTLPDTDWHLERLYDFLGELDASVLVATHSRYVIDLNRPPDDTQLYPGQDTTGLVPTDTFARDPIYRGREAADEREVADRIERYWRPYHERLQHELARLRAAHGYALLWDAHSIASEVPRFFAGRLPHLNLGTADGAACAFELEHAVAGAAQRWREHSMVLNGRFKGGYITRAYGKPASRVHAIQLELAQRTYMDEARPYAFRADLAAQIRPVLRALMDAFLQSAKSAA